MMVSLLAALILNARKSRWRNILVPLCHRIQINLATNRVTSGILTLLQFKIFYRSTICASKEIFSYLFHSLIDTQDCCDRSKSVLSSRRTRIVMYLDFSLARVQIFM